MGKKKKPKKRSPKKPSSPASSGVRSGEITLISGEQSTNSDSIAALIETNVDLPSIERAVSQISEPAAVASAPTPDQISKSNKLVSPNQDYWCDLVKFQGRKLEKKGESFTLPSGELCVRIPNSVIEKNKKSWEFFVLGQFDSPPPARGTIHSIANEKWSRQHRDIIITKMEGNAFLFRIPNALTRSRVINQRLWQFEKQTMVVTKFEPGVIPAKHDLVVMSDQKDPVPG